MLQYLKSLFGISDCDHDYQFYEVQENKLGGMYVDMWPKVYHACSKCRKIKSSHWKYR